MKHILTITMLACGLLAQAQTASKKNRLRPATHPQAAAKTQTVAPDPTYSFNTYTAPYQAITGNSANNGNKWDEADYTIPLGFTFKLYNKQGSSIHLIGGSGITFDDLNTATSLALAAPMDEDLCDHSFDTDNDNENDPNGSSPISYTTTGTAPNRICHIQVSNAGFWGEMDSLGVSAPGFANFQIRLFETSNIIEFHYGNCNVPHPDLSFNAGTAGFACDLLNITSLTTFNMTGNALNGPYASPSMVGPDFMSSASNAVSGTIVSGRVYQFVNTTTTGTYTAVRDQQAEGSVSLYPNPAKDKLTVSGKELHDATFELRDLTGRLMHTASANGEVNLPSLTKGIYFARILSAEGAELYNSKLIISE